MTAPPYLRPSQGTGTATDGQQMTNPPQTGHRVTDDQPPTGYRSKRPQMAKQGTGTATDGQQMANPPKQGSGVLANQRANRPQEQANAGSVTPTAHNMTKQEQTQEQTNRPQMTAPNGHRWPTGHGVRMTRPKVNRSTDDPLYINII